MSLNANVRAFLDEPRFAVLATTNEDGTIQQTVMWYLLRDDMIVMNTAYSRVKHKNLLRDPRISICVDDGYRYVTIAGTARLEENERVAQQDVRELAIRYNGPDAGEAQALEFNKEQRVSIYLPISRMIVRGV